MSIFLLMVKKERLNMPGRCIATAPGHPKQKGKIKPLFLRPV
uniref:Uncharacterized protein n=1 Tax=Geobacter sp. (strain M21) TaxID=443144 RepID=C6DYW0_GEOSM